jgi:curved DNA-binding protein
MPSKNRADGSGGAFGLRWPSTAFPRGLPTQHRPLRDAPTLILLLIPNSLTFRAVGSSEFAGWHCDMGRLSLPVSRIMPPDYYALLGLSRRCTADQVRDAYRRLAKQFHPDLNPGSAETVERTQELNAAYAVLGDPDRRRIYDDSLGAAATPKRTAKPQQNISQDVSLRLEEFFRGTRLEVRVNDPGNAAGPETYSLEVPPATAPGTRFRVRREGDFSGSHVLVRVRARPDSRFKIRGSDLRCDLRLQARRVAQGGWESVRGATGNSVRVPIPPGVARGEVIRIDGEGLPKPRGGRGDLLVRILYTPEIRITRRSRPGI